MKNIILLWVFMACSCYAEKFNTSFNSNQLNIEERDGILYLNYSINGHDVIRQSPLILKEKDANLTWKVISKKESEQEQHFQLTMGETSSIHERFKELSFDLKVTNSKQLKNGRLRMRMYDNNTLAYRWELDNQEEIEISEETSFFLSDTNGFLYAPNGEYEPIGPHSLSDNQKKFFTPIVYQCDQYILGIHEAGLTNYPQLFTTVEDGRIKLNPGKASIEKGSLLPWRVLLAGKDMTAIHKSKTVFYGLNEPSKGDFSWVKPGIAVWDWRVIGGTYDGYTYSNDKQSLKRYIDFASEQGFPYCQVDAVWKFDCNPITFFEEYGIREIIEYARNKNVGIWLYYDLNYLKNGTPEVSFEEIASTYASWGVKGIKYGFLGIVGNDIFSSQKKVHKTEEIISIAAKNKLMVIFHDSPVPFSGLERTYPNYVNREYCHSQMDRRTSFTPQSFVKMACINTIAGFIDQTNGTYDINNMERSYGPKNGYESTVSAETARFFITYSGTYAMLLDAPEAYRKKNDLFDFIRLLPDVWDETIHLEMDINSHVSVARRKGSDWFVGTVFNEKGGNHVLNLNFLEDDKTYEATVYKDMPDSHYQKKKEAYQIDKINVHNKSQINVWVAPGGGYSVFLQEK